MTKKVLLGLSGGVDSAVAAHLLQKEGYEVIGAFMKNFSDTKNQLTGDCNWVEDRKDAQKVAAKLNIPLITLDFEDEYKKYVIDPMFDDYAKGLTPNPDSLCNKIIKFPLLWKEAQKRGCDYIATGHYIKRTYNKKTNEYELHIPKDTGKDQSYFLYELTQTDIKHSLFPIADYTKDEVRAIAKKHNLHNFDKHGTRGICFVGKVDLKEFLKQRIKPKQGKILNDRGKQIGVHDGVMYFTIGERASDKHMEIFKEFRNAAKQKLFIARKNPKNNTLVVVPKPHSLLTTKEFYVRKLHFISKHDKQDRMNIKIRYRHLAPLIPATLTKVGSRWKCTTKQPIEALADGQSCIFYKGTKMLGGGEIRFS